jgi:hypothetical protein
MCSDISEKCITFISRVEKSVEQKKKQCAVGGQAPAYRLEFSSSARAVVVLPS